MDVEGSFDNIDLDLLCEFLMARGCTALLCSWVRQWAGHKVVRFRFNGCVSKHYFVNKSVPQGSPLFPFLFGVYVADIFRPRIIYRPSYRSMLLSYLDDAVIAVAADTRSTAYLGMVDVFLECDAVARGRGIEFSVIKTNWIGMGGSVWDGVEIMGNVLELVTALRVLGYRFNVFNNFSAHVIYWLERGLGVWNRISTLEKRFGENALDAWGTYHLIQAAYLPTVYYGLEFLTDHWLYVRKIQVHINDTLRSLF